MIGALMRGSASAREISSLSLRNDFLFLGLLILPSHLPPIKLLIAGLRELGWWGVKNDPLIERMQEGYEVGLLGGGEVERVGGKGLIGDG